MPLLHDYYRSSAAYRVRIALNLKGIAYDSAPVQLLRGEQQAPAYLALNPAGLVPTYSDAHGVFSQSLAIIEYLEETQPEPALLPKQPAARAWVRSVALSVACDVHPLTNLRVLQYLERELAVSERDREAYRAHWLEHGLASVEAMLARGGQQSEFAFGDAPGLADICIVPQVFNALRFACKLEHVPRVMALYERCTQLPAFARAAPEAVAPP